LNKEGQLKDKNTEKSKVIDLTKHKNKKSKEEVKEPPVMKPNFDVDDFFAKVIKQNKKAKKAEEDRRKKDNEITKRRYDIDKGSKDV